MGKGKRNRRERSKDPRDRLKVLIAQLKHLQKFHEIKAANIGARIKGKEDELKELNAKV